PAAPLQPLAQRLALGLARAAPGDVAQALGDHGRGPRGRGVPVTIAGGQGIERLLAVAQHHHAPDDVLELADVARPRVLSETDEGLRGDLLLAGALPDE